MTDTSTQTESSGSCSCGDIDVHMGKTFLHLKGDNVMVVGNLHVDGRLSSMHLETHHIQAPRFSDTIDIHGNVLVHGSLTSIVPTTAEVNLSSMTQEVNELKSELAYMTSRFAAMAAELQKMKQDHDLSQHRVTDAHEKINHMWEAPGMPGYVVARDSWNAAVSRSAT